MVSKPSEWLNFNNRKTQSFQRSHEHLKDESITFKKFNKVQLKYSILLIFCFISLYGSDINQFVEDGYIIINTESEQEYEEVLANLIDNPLLWKMTNSSQLENLPINDFLKSSLIHFYKNNSKITTWETFKNKSGFSEIEINLFRLFITFEEKKSICGKIYNFNSLQGEDNFAINKNLVRMKMDTPRGWNIGGIIERDQDEIHVFDHVNFSVQSPLLFDRVKINLGSFRFKWGTGLFFNTNPMNMIGNSGSGNIYNTDAKFQGYSGSDENNHLFGTSISYQSKFANIFTFYSQNNMDCNIENGIVTSADYTGFHVSENDMKNHNKLRNITTGVGSSFDIRRFQIGVFFYNSDFNYQLEDFDGQKSITGSSIFHNYQYINIYFKGEFAYSFNQKYALTQSIFYRGNRIQTGCNLRYFQPEFQSFAGSTIRHFSGNLENEKGFYFYFGVRINKSTKLTLFNDIYSRIIPANVGDEITKGTYSGVYLKHNLQSKSYLEFKLSRKNNLQNIKKSYSVKLKHQLIKNLDFINRYYFTEIIDTKSHSNGFSSYFFAKMKMQSVSVGTTHFFSSSSDCNLYIYEPGIPLRYNMVTLSGTGRNYFVNYSCQINQQTEIFLMAKQSSKSQQEKYFLQLQLLVAL